MLGALGLRMWAMTSQANMTVIVLQHELAMPIVLIKLAANRQPFFYIAWGSW